jgi:hypothetical protein
MHCVLAQARVVDRIELSACSLECCLLSGMAAGEVAYYSLALIELMMSGVVAVLRGAARPSSS